MVDIKEEFFPIAVRDDLNGKNIISYNPQTKEYLLSISGKLAGPITLKEIEILQENLKDVLELKGRYLFIKEYDIQGNRT